MIISLLELKDPAKGCSPLSLACLVLQLASVRVSYLGGGEESVLSVSSDCTFPSPNGAQCILTTCLWNLNARILFETGNLSFVSTNLGHRLCFPLEILLASSSSIQTREVKSDSMWKERSTFKPPGPEGRQYYYYDYYYFTFFLLSPLTLLWLTKSSPPCQQCHCAVTTNG